MILLDYTLINTVIYILLLINQGIFTSIVIILRAVKM